MSEGTCDGWQVTIEILRLSDDGDSIEEYRLARFSTKALAKCPACGWLNYTPEDWDDSPLVCENPACRRARDIVAEEYGGEDGLYIYCRPCERWVAADDFPRHLLANHCRLHSPDDDPYDIIPGQEWQPKGASKP